MIRPGAVTPSQPEPTAVSEAPSPANGVAKATTADVILAGGGLANVLIALRLKAVRPSLRLLVVERDRRFGGNHTWSFHDTDLTAAQLAALAPLIIAHWPAQEVRFPSHSRRLATGYNSISSDRLHEVATERLGSELMLGAAIAEVHPERVVLGDGRVLTAPCVIDGRGALGEQPLALGYQKFLGLEVETAGPHGLANPIIMDATVPQRDGYRFVYSLPLTPTRLMIEDTYYSDTPDIDRARLTQDVHGYAVRQGWRIAEVVREEAAVLPITLAGDIDAHWRTLGSAQPRSGLRAWLFHPTTGYSLPYAVRLADAIAASPRLTSAAIAPLIERISRDAWSAQSFFRLLNRMLFVAATPDERVIVLQRFYTLPEPLIRRFYAARLTSQDRARILIGRPPIPILRAARSMSESAAWSFVASQPTARQLG
jgi:lycopene beta-cyclase